MFNIIQKLEEDVVSNMRVRGGCALHVSMILTQGRFNAGPPALANIHSTLGIESCWLGAPCLYVSVPRSLHTIYIPIQHLNDEIPVFIILDKHVCPK